MLWHPNASNDYGVEHELSKWRRIIINKVIKKDERSSENHKHQIQHWTNVREYLNGRKLERHSEFKPQEEYINNMHNFEESSWKT
jgi:hypothetical protein